jgi:hypothetical protein
VAFHLPASCTCLMVHPLYPYFFILKVPSLPASAHSVFLYVVLGRLAFKMRSLGIFRSTIFALICAFVTRGITALDSSTDAAEDDDVLGINSPYTFYSALGPCPAPCFGNPENWTVYSAFERLSVCNQPLLLDSNIYNSIVNPASTLKLRVCTAGDGDPKGGGNALVARDDSLPLPFTILVRHQRTSIHRL